MKTIADLEAASNAATDAHDRALARQVKIQKAIDLLLAVDDMCSDSDLTDADRAQLDTIDAAACYVYLSKQKAALRTEIDRLETLCHEAAHALNSADEAA